MRRGRIYLFVLRCDITPLPVFLPKYTVLGEGGVAPILRQRCIKRYRIRIGRDYCQTLETRVPAECVQRCAPGFDVLASVGTFSVGGAHDVIGFT